MKINPTFQTLIPPLARRIGLGGLIAFTSLAALGSAVDGEVYITTKGRDTIKMSLTSVMLVESSNATKQLEYALRCKRASREMDSLADRISALVYAMPKMNATDRSVAGNTWVSLRNEYKELMADGANGKKPIYQLLSELDWQPAATSQTDANGKFQMELPSTTNQWKMVVFSRRLVGGKYEEYIWIVPVRAGQPNMLNNSNLLGE